MGLLAQPAQQAPRHAAEAQARRRPGDDAAAGLPQGCRPLQGWYGHQGLGAAAWLYTVHVAIGASYIFINFAVSHTHRDVVPANKHISWTLYSANHTTNCTPSWWCNWWMAYLNFQIEHHLFPAMPQYRHPQICHRVKALFDKHGVEYDVRPYTTCMAATFQNLWDVGH